MFDSIRSSVLFVCPLLQCVPVLVVQTLIACNLLQRHESLYYIDHKSVKRKVFKIQESLHVRNMH